MSLCIFFLPPFPSHPLSPLLLLRRSLPRRPFPRNFPFKIPFKTNFQSFIGVLLATGSHSIHTSYDGNGWMTPSLAFFIAAAVSVFARKKHWFVSWMSAFLCSLWSELKLPKLKDYKNSKDFEKEKRIKNE